MHLHCQQHLAVETTVPGVQEAQDCARGANAALLSSRVQAQASRLRSSQPFICILSQLGQEIDHGKNLGF